jgi:type IV pilus assembly protein PilY1
MKHMLNRGAVATVFFISILLLAPHARAEITDLSDVPLANSASTAVLPNLMYILDDSGSMTWDYMPDTVYNYPNCKYCSSTSTSSCSADATYCMYNADNVNSGYGQPPYFSNDFNQIYYNPDITYSPAVTSTGLSMGNQPPTAAQNDPFGVMYSGTSDLTKTFPDVYFCNIPSPSVPSSFTNTNVCRRNGIDNVQTGTNNYFLYFSNNVAAGTPLGGYPVATGTPATSFIYPVVNFAGHPFYFTISPNEYCSDANLINCALANTDGSAPTGFSIPAPLRYCGTPANAALSTAVSDTATVTTPKCRKKFDATSYTAPRYGRFRRVDLVPTLNNYPLRSTSMRTDCAGSTASPPFCTYAEEIQNFANWYSYYRIRLMMMKTASGQAFLAIDNRYRVGFITINPNTPVTGNKYLPLATFDSGQKSSFYSILYSQNNNGGTPLRQALARVGRHYAGLTSGINSGMPQDPIQYSCQQNFALLTSDGYWNEADALAVDLNNNPVGNQDNVANTSAPIFVSRATGTLDGLGTQTTNVQPTTTLEQTLCTANNATAFSAGAQTTCGCAAGQKRIMQRTISQTTTTQGTDNIQTSQITTTSPTTFQAITSCSSLVSTAVTPATVVEQQVITANAATTFAAVNGVSAGANITGPCAAGKKVVVQRTTTYNATVVTTDGVAAAPTNSGTAYSFATIGSCVSPQVTTAVTPTTIVAQQVVTNNALTTFAAVNGLSTGANANGTCSGGKKSVIQRTTTYNTTVVTTDGVVGSPTTSGTAYSFSNPFTGCTTNTLTAAATTTTNGSTSSATAGGPTPIAATAASSTGTTTTTTNGGTTLTTANITINPNPQVTPGTATTTSIPGGTPNTLADVAMYYYKTDLRTSGAMATNNVPTTQKDITPQQHMVTFTLGLGLTGLLDYIPNYDTSTTGDFAKIKNSSTGCSWTTGTCNWPAPVSGTNTTLDDLWHAAVNGRGFYYSASNPNTLSAGLAGALSALKVATAAASASATSTPNITLTNNFIYSSTFRTVNWDGEITAQQIDPATGNVLAPIVWSAQTQLDALASPTSDTRTIYTFSATNSNKLRPFLWTSLSSTEQAIFANQCPALSQCPTLSIADQANANSGPNLVNFLRGQSQYSSSVTSPFRFRQHVLGDSTDAAPLFVQTPHFSFNDSVTPSYATFQANNASRQPMLYVAANDGMLHAFNGATGAEVWAYVPRIVFSLLPGLASDNWDVRHKNIVDGSPQLMDVYDSTLSKWRTILIAGLNKGGRGFYALDITDPNSPQALWEICSDSTVCAISDADIGDSYGYPVITKRPADGKWVALVTSGMNNVSPGTGRGFLYVLDALSGAILTKVETGAGNTTTPSGLSRISAFANNFSVDNTATYVYGGDLYGNVWRFDMTAATPAVLKLAQLTDSTGNPQSITARPELSIISGFRVVYVGTGRYLGASDLADPATLTPPEQWAYQQSLYAIKDRNVALGNVRTSSPGLVQQTLTTTSLTTRSTSSNAVDWSGKDGWYVDFNPGNASPGERVNLDPQLVLGTLLVGTAVPNNSVCSVGGDSWLYQFNYQSGAFIASAPNSVVGQKFTGTTLVGIVVVALPSGNLKVEATDSTGNKTTVGVNAGGAGGSGKRVSWRELIQ